MNAPFSTVGAPEPQIVVFTPAMRTLIADAIESLILLLDEIDGDADHEEDADFEEGSDAEPSLGAVNLDTHVFGVASADEGVARQSGWEARDNQDGFSAVATRG
jgi:hypothetical protein